ncbi:MAG: peptidase associated/transthyretin-like domain-containing protein [Armatimonadota bacterium]
MRLSTIALLLCSAVLIVMTGCGGGGDDDGGGGGRVLSGRVVDAGSLQPLSDIRVVVEGRETTTGTDGNWQLSNVSANASSVTIAGTNYVSQSLTTAGDGRSQDFGDILLVPAPVNGTGNVTGFVTLAGNVVGGAVITAGGRTAVSRSDAPNQGLYTLYNVPAGIATLNATYTEPGASTANGASFSVTVENMITTSANVTLGPQPPPPPPL